MNASVRGELNENDGVHHQDEVKSEFLMVFYCAVVVGVARPHGSV